MPLSKSKRQTRLAHKRMRSDARAARVLDAREAARINWAVNFGLVINFHP